MYEIHTTKALDKILEKLSKKNPKQMEIISKKVEEIAQNPNRYKNLRKPLQHLKRVHVDSSFVLTFTVNNKKRTITLVDYDHHDNIYQ